MTEQDRDARPPVLFVHGNGDSSALWLTTLWRYESAGYQPHELQAIDFPYPTARDDEDIPQAGRSSAAEQREQLAGFVADFATRVGGRRIALVGSSRGGNAIRGYLKRDGAGRASHALLCGTPNHGVFSLPGNNKEFNAQGRVLRELNAGDEIVPGIAWATIRSARDDKFAQPDLGPGQPPGTGYDGPALRGAANVVLAGADHREVAFSRPSFVAQYHFLTGEVTTGAIVPEPSPRLGGTVTGYEHGAPTNLGVPDARVTVFEIDAESGERRGNPIHQATTGPDGSWGSFVASPAARYEFVVEAPGQPARHWFRSPFPRSTALLQFRLDGEAAPPPGLGTVIFSRPRGYISSSRDTFHLDGQPVPGFPGGVPVESRVRLPGDGPHRALHAELNGERITLRTVPGALSYAEFHY